MHPLVRGPPEMQIRGAAARISTFLAQVRHRHTFRVALFYAAAAWLVLQVGQSVLPIMLDRPQPWLRALLAVLVAGFLLAVALGWYADLTRDRRRAARRDEPTPRATAPQREPERVQSQLSPEHDAALQRAMNLLEQRAPSALREALDVLDGLAEATPASAAVHAARAEALALLADVNAMPASSALPKAKRAARRAVELDASRAAGYDALAFAATLDWDWAEARAAFSKAVALAPRSARIRQRLAVYLAAMGRLPEAIEQTRIARELDPDCADLQTLSAALHYYARDADRAIAEARVAVERQPGSGFARLILALALEQRGECGRAADELKQAIAARVVDEGLLLAALGHVYATEGRSDAARRTLETLLPKANSSVSHARAAPAFALAALQTALGEYDAAFESLRRAIGERDGWLLSLRVHPWLDALRSDARYVKLLQRMGLAGAPGDEDPLRAGVG